MKNSDFCTEWNLLVTLLIWQNSQVKQRRENLFSSWFQRFHFTVCWLYNFWTTAKQRKAVHFMVSRKQGWGRDKTYPYKACSQWLTSSTWAHFLISTIFHPSNAIKLLFVSRLVHWYVEVLTQSPLWSPLAANQAFNTDLAEGITATNIRVNLETL